MLITTNKEEKTQSLTIIQQNIQDWKSNGNSFKNSIRQIYPDVILLNDTGMKDTEHIKIPGYIIMQSNKTGEKYKGSAIAIKNTIRYLPVHSFNNDFLAVTVPIQDDKITIATYYKPPRLAEVPVKELLNLANRNEPTYFIGDLNLRHSFIGHADNNEAGKIIYELVNSGKIIHIGPEFNTTYRFKNISKPDIVFSNAKAYHNYHIKEGPITTSDHRAIEMKISANPIQIPIKPRRAPHQTKWIHYKEDTIIEKPNLEGKPIKKIDKLATKILKTMRTAMEKHTPIIEYRRLPYPEDNPKITQLKNELHIENHPYIRRMKNNNNAERIAYLRNQLRMEIQKQTRISWDKLMYQIEGKKDKDFWEQVKRLRGNKPIKRIVVLKDEQGKELNTDEEIAEAHTKRMVKAYTIDETNTNFIKSNETKINRWYKNNEQTWKEDNLIDTSKLNNTGLDRKITKYEVTRAISMLKEKTPGFSQITSQYYKNLPEQTVLTLQYLFNCMLATGHTPQLLKHADLLMIPKPGKNKNELSGYRPIALLDTLIKIMERIMLFRLTQFLNSKKIINNNFHGFRANRGTFTAISIATENIAKALHENKRVSMVLRDIKGAFDRVWIKGLIYKIKNINLPPLNNRWHINYLTNHTACIKYNDTYGRIFNLQNGVKQGSILSPTYFTIFTHDTPLPVKQNKQFIYADDHTQLIITGKNANHGKHILNAIKKINQFEARWKIQTCPDKFNIIHFTENPDYLREIDPKLITNKGKFLGLKITNKGYGEHVTEMKNRASVELAKLHRFKNLRTDQKRLLYTALVRSILTYPAIPLCVINQKMMKKLQVVQNKACKFITGYKYKHDKRCPTSKTLHREAGLQPLNIVLNNQAQKYWQKIEEIDEQTCNELRTYNPYTKRKHKKSIRNYFKRSIFEEEVEPRYT